MALRCLSAATPCLWTCQPAAGAQQLRRQLLQVHLAGCRLVHWLSQRAAASGRIEFVSCNRGLADQLPSNLLLFQHTLCLVQQRVFDVAAAAGQLAG